MTTEKQKIIVFQQENSAILGDKFANSPKLTIAPNIDFTTLVAIKEYFSHLIVEKKYSQHTIKAYQSDLYSFFCHIYQQNSKSENNISLALLAELDTTQIRNWLASEFANKSNRSKARSLATIRSFFRFNNLRNIINNQEIAKINNPKLAKLLPKAVESNHIAIIIKGIQEREKDQWEKDRDLAILLLLYGSGLRISEALSISKTSINSDNLVKICGKGNKDRLVPILPIARVAIDNYLKNNPLNNCILPNQPIFLNANGKNLTSTQFAQIIAKIRKQYQLPENITPHSFRHSFASDLLANGANLRIIQSLLGHESLATTEIYTKIDKNKIISDYSKFFKR
jgi:integrase/recombinase XerC